MSQSGLYMDSWWVSLCRQRPGCRAGRRGPSTGLCTIDSCLCWPRLLCSPQSCGPPGTAPLSRADAGKQHASLLQLLVPSCPGRVGPSSPGLCPVSQHSEHWIGLLFLFPHSVHQGLPALVEFLAGTEGLGLTNIDRMNFKFHTRNVAVKSAAIYKVVQTNLKFQADQRVLWIKWLGIMGIFLDFSLFIFWVLEAWLWNKATQTAAAVPDSFPPAQEWPSLDARAGRTSWLLLCPAKSHPDDKLHVSGVFLAWYVLPSRTRQIHFLCHSF